MDTQTQLEQAESQMREAAKRLMQTPIPRDANQAWKGVAMQFSESFVLENHAALQKAFDSGFSANPMEPSEDEVKRLAEAWEPFFTHIERQITAGFDTSEPTSLMWSISRYLSVHDPIKAKKFDNRFFKHLD